MAFVAVGAGRLVQSDELPVVFAAGVAFVQVVPERTRARQRRGQTAYDVFYMIPIFGLLGTALPWGGWADLGWRGPLLAASVLLLRRPPGLLLLRPLLPTLRTRADALFVGWFGPVAVGAIYYAALMERRLGDPLVWHIVSLVICASVVVHGSTAAPLTFLYGRTGGPTDESAAG